MVKRNRSLSSFLAVFLAMTGTMSSIDAVAPAMKNSKSNSKVHTVRGSPREKASERQHVIKRVYGPNNAITRKNIAEVEEEMERYRTGLNKHNHELEYENHPFDKTRKNRELKETDDIFQPIRIKFETMALDSQRNGVNAAQIDFIKNEILPKTRDFWTNTVSVVPVANKLFISAAELDSRTYCGDSEFTRVSDEDISVGIEDTDLMLYVSGTPSSRFCSGSTLAVAVACNFDQYDRPTAGAINFCLDQINLKDDGTASDSIIQDNVDVAIHEAAHVLGMSSNSYRFFWDSETGEPRTRRPFASRTVDCVDGVSRSLVLPDKETMDFFRNELTGQRYASIVTPKVRAVARNQFNCQTMAGGQLENQPTGAQSCTGDHWDERLYYPESLSGVISPTTNVLSHITLALLEDSGWYKANYTMGKALPWGLNAGCDFVKSPCLIPNGDTPSIPEYSKGYFCNDASQRGCSPALTHKLQCTVIDYEHIYPQNLPEPRFQYFPFEPTRGGPRQADYCPVFGSTYNGYSAEQLDCQNPDHAASSLNFVNSEEFGSESKCFETSSGEGRCYRSACVKDEMKVKFQIRGLWYTCDYDFHVLSVPINNFQTIDVRCPRLSSICPDLFCPFNCAGRGVCNYSNHTPFCECFDKNDTSTACSDSLVPNGDFFQDSSGLLSNLEERFFDPLFSVFVDHPDRWTNASWAWAAGILTLVLIMCICIGSSLWPQKEAKVVSSER